MKKKREQLSCDALIFGASGFACTLWGRVLSETSLLAGVIAENKHQGLLLKNQAITRLEQLDFDFSKNLCGFVNPFSQYDEFISLADNRQIKYIFYTPAQFFFGDEAVSSNDLLGFFTMFLFRRFCVEEDGFTVFVPNRLNLKEEICSLALSRELGYDFISWLNMHVNFYPYITFFAASEKACEVECEVFVESDKPIDLFASSHCVRVLASLSYQRRLEDFFCATVYSCAAYARLHDIETMHAFLSREKSQKFLTSLIQEELSPFFEISFEDKQVFFLQMLKRLQNPAFPLKFACLPSLAKTFGQTAANKIRANYKQNGIAPRHLTVALFCILEAYKVFEINDESTAFLTENTLPKILKNRRLWHCDLSFLSNDIRDVESKLK